VIGIIRPLYVDNGLQKGSDMEQEFELSDEGKSYVPIDDSTRLAITPRNWQLQKKTVALTGKNAGTTTWTAFRYYTGLESALKDIVHIKTAQESFRSAQGLIEANQRVIDGLVEAFSPHYHISRSATQRPVAVTE
jgi:hypothetical protein